MQEQISQFLTSLVTQHNRSSNTVIAYRNDLTQFLTYLDQASLPPDEAAGKIGTWTEVDDTVLQNYLIFCNTHNYTSATIARKLAAVKSLFKFLYRSGVVLADY
ncbi:MAG: site-specific integrase, partial [Chloroflexota bacterium]|nr:site-specific integrase [Chloroflexota bacterium]